MKKFTLFFLGLLFLSIGCQRKPGPRRAVSTDAFEKAYALLSVNQDSAFYYFNRLVSESRDSLHVGLAYTNMAMIQSDAGDYFGAQESLISSVRFLGESHAARRPYQAQNYNELAITALKLKNFKEAIGYCKQALSLTNDSSFRTNIYNNEANAYRYQRKYRLALEHYRQAIRLTDRHGKPFARVLTNYAIARWLDRPAYNPIPELMQSLQIRIREKDLWGQNSSYAHLADYYTGKVPDSALYYARKRHETARQLNSPDDELESLQKLLVLIPGDRVRSYINRFTFLNDSLQTARNAAKNQFALIRYDAEKNKADNLRLQKTNADKEYQLSRQRLLLWGGLLLVLSGMALALLWYRKRKQRMIWETQIAIQDLKLQTSKRVHDVVANGLYRLMTEIDYRDKINKEDLLDRIEVLYERSRDISYEQEPSPTDDFQGTVADLLESFATDQVKILMVGNSAELWAGVSRQIKDELLPVLQELLVNMKKHSGAKAVTIRFEMSAGQLLISYADDGAGLPVNVNFGNGLQNTGNRIQRLSGTVNFDSDTAKGVHVSICIPVA